MTCPACNRPATAHRWHRDGVEFIESRCGEHIAHVWYLSRDSFEDPAAFARRVADEYADNQPAATDWPPLAWADSDGMAVIEFSDASERTVREQ